MMLDLSSAAAILVFALPLLFLILFLPAFIELRNPKDHGPRFLSDFPELRTDSANFAGISNLEMEQEFELSLIGKLFMVLEVLPNLEV